MTGIELLKNLIKIKSYSGDEKDITLYISNWFKQRNIKTQKQDQNIFVYLKGKDNSKAFIINSHMDTVNASDLTKWIYGPWKPAQKGKKLYGLGASDMKSGLTASMLLVDKYSKGKNIPVDLWFTYVVKEELDGSGTKSFIEWFKERGYLNKYKEIAAIFTEPTALKEIEYGHRGNFFIKVESKGDSGHASYPELIKKHAVREMIKFSDLLQKESIKWKKQFLNKEFKSPTVGELTSISAGKSANSFPSKCEATFDIRTTPEFHKVALRKIKDVGKKANVKISLAYPEAPAGYTNPKDKIIKIAKNNIKNPILSVSRGSADLGFLSKYEVSAIILGPGVKNQAHRINEYCYPSEIGQAVKLYTSIIEGWSK